MKTKNIAILPRTVALAAMGLSLSVIHQAKAAGFVSVSRMKNARNDHTATLLPNGKVLIGGGFNLGSSAELYDPATDMWTVTGSLRAARASHTATLLPNGKVLVTGGLQSGGGYQASTSAELYDPATGNWGLTGPMKRARSGPTATLLLNGKVLVVGGTGDGSSELYDPASETWTATGSASSGHRTATLLHNGKVLLAGGDGVELYDPVTGTWTTTTSASSGEYETATLLLNGKVLVAGGNRIVTAELYDPGSGTWMPTGSLTWDRAYCTATLLRNGQVLIAGGFQQGPDIPIPSAELYDPITGTWTETPMNGERFDHTATLLPDGKVLVAGGLDFPPIRGLSSAELYEPDEPLLTLLRNADQTLSLSWGGAGVLEQAESLMAPTWQPASNQANPQTISTTSTMKFFRLKAE